MAATNLNIKLLPIYITYTNIIFKEIREVLYNYLLTVKKNVRSQIGLKIALFW